MVRRVAWYFILVGIVLLAVALVLAMGQQSSGRALLWGLGSLIAGVWVLLRTAAAPAAPPVEAKAKEAGKPPAPKPEAKPAAPKAPAKPRGLGGMFRPRTKSRA